MGIHNLEQLFQDNIECLILKSHETVILSINISSLDWNCTNSVIILYVNVATPCFLNVFIFKSLDISVKPFMCVGRREREKERDYHLNK